MDTDENSVATHAAPRGRGFGGRGGGGGEGRGRGGRGGRGHDGSHRGGRGDGGRGRGAGRGRGRGAAGGENEKYVVIIRNVENDFARIHEEAVQRYLCLNDAANAKQKQHFRKAATDGAKAKNDGAASESSSTAKDACTYTVTARSETRSVELEVRGGANAPIGSIFTPVSVKNPNGVQAAAKRPREDDERFSTLGDMAAIFKSKPYFTHPPSLFLNLPDGDAAALTEEEQRSLRLRWSLSCAPPSTAKKDESSNQNGDDDEDDDSGRKQCVYLTRFRQADAVSVEATISSHVTAREVRAMLQNAVPGFVSCWHLHGQTFRIVFEGKEPLFKAKQLLDQFVTDSHKRVTLHLPDGLRREFEEAAAAEGEENA